MPEKAIEYKHAGETLDLISHFTGSERYRELYRERKGELKDMKTAADCLIDKGRREGLEQGSEMSLIQSVKALMETQKMTKEEAFNALKVPEEKRPYYLQKIG